MKGSAKQLTDTKKYSVCFVSWLTEYGIQQEHEVIFF